ncbi:MAG: 3-methyl-2-oxobutanoate hydroxymethyltransferase [bacterium]
MKDKITIRDLQNKKGREKIVSITAYDAPSGAIVDEAGAHLVLVGDSAAMVVLGYDNTLPIDLDTMIIFSMAVSRTIKRAHICLDMPFLSYQVCLEEGIRNCGRALKEGGAESVKIEGAHTDLVKALVDIGIPVLGHLGFVPQSYHALGGYRVIGKVCEEAERVIKDAVALQEAGVYALVLESVPEEVSDIITKNLKIPTIGIGAGRGCDGQIIVLHDIIGLYKPTPRHAHLYRDVYNDILQAVKQFAEDVKDGKFPSDENVSHIKDDILRELKERLKKGGLIS